MGEKIIMKSTQDKVDIMYAYLNGSRIKWTNGEQRGVHQLKDETPSCTPLWNWGETSYEILPKEVKGSAVMYANLDEDDEIISIYVNYANAELCAGANAKRIGVQIDVQYKEVLP